MDLERKEAQGAVLDWASVVKVESKESMGSVFSCRFLESSKPRRTNKKFETLTNSPEKYRFI